MRRAVISLRDTFFQGSPGGAKASSTEAVMIPA